MATQRVIGGESLEEPGLVQGKRIGLYRKTRPFPPQPPRPCRVSSVAAASAVPEEEVAREASGRKQACGQVEFQSRRGLGVPAPAPQNPMMAFYFSEPQIHYGPTWPGHNLKRGSLKSHYGECLL